MTELIAAGADARELAAKFMDRLRYWTGNEHFYPVDELATLLESFRAATHDGCTEIINTLSENQNQYSREVAELKRQLEIVRAAALEQAAQIADACQKDATGDVHNVYANLAWIAPRIRALSPSPNWLARQIASEKVRATEQAAQHAVKFLRAEGWGGPILGRLLDSVRSLAALESASAKLGDKGESR